MLRVLFIAAALLFNTASMAEADTPVNFEMTISTTALRVGQPIGINFKVTNPLNRPVVYHLDDGYLASYIKVIDRAGRVMPWERVSLYDRPWEKLTTHTLKPFESFTVFIQPTLRINDNNELVLDFVHSHIVLKRVGEFTLVGYLRGYDKEAILLNEPKKESDDPNLPITFTGEAFSNSFQVDIRR